MKIPLIKERHWLGFLAAALVFMFGPRLEGKYLPVVTDTHVLRVEAVDDDHAMFWGSTNKVRDCEFDHIVWYFEEDGRRVNAPVNFMGRARVRRPANFDFGPWLVPIAADELLLKSFALVYHKCYWFAPFWKTETKFYP